MTTPDCGDRSTALASLGPKMSGQTRVDTSLYCSERCRLAGLTVAVSGNTGSQVRGTVTISDLTVGGERLPITDEGTWTSTRTESGTGIDVSTKGDDLHLDLGAADGADVTTYVTDVPRPMPAVVSSPDVAVGDELEVIDVSGGQTAIVVDQHVAALPSVTDRGVLLSLPALARVNGEIATRAEKQIWLADASPAAVERAGDVLAEEDVTIRSVTTTKGADRVFDQSASGWGLQLALIGGALAILLAALVLVILAVTGWRAAARDLAALRISRGQPARHRPGVADRAHGDRRRRGPPRCRLFSRRGAAGHARDPALHHARGGPRARPVPGLADRAGHDRGRCRRAARPRPGHRRRGRTSGAPLGREG